MQHQFSVQPCLISLSLSLSYLWGKWIAKKWRTRDNLFFLKIQRCENCLHRRFISSPWQSVFRLCNAVFENSYRLFCPSFLFPLQEQGWGRATSRHLVRWILRNLVMNFYNFVNQMHAYHHELQMAFPSSNRVNLCSLKPTLHFYYFWRLHRFTITCEKCIWG